MKSSIEYFIMNHRLKFCIFVLFCSLLTCEGKYGYVICNNNKYDAKTTDYFADIPEVHVARATYSNEINETGWAFLEIHTSPGIPDEQQAFGAGFIEGFLTKDLIWYHWQNMLKGYCFNKTDVCGLIEEYVDKNEEYISSMVRKNGRDPYWYQVKLYYIQIEGLAAGYNSAITDEYQWLSVRDILWINMLGDLDELAFALSLPKVSPDGMLFPDHCTGLVKLLPDLTNLYVAQATWNSYQSMLRLQKMYVLNYRLHERSNKLIPGRKMAMSSYPAFIQSTDDFYIISSGLVAAETTIGNSNRSLYEHVKPYGQLMEFVRAMVANRLAHSGKEWVDIFRRHNSGTYNNQWYIVDYKKFQPRTDQNPEAVIQSGLLWVIEQLPGYTEAADLTAELKQESYFPSYNIPYFPRVFNLSGGWVRVETYGDWFGYDTNPRAKIIKEKQGKIRNLRDMYYTMRYNDFKHDPLSRCDKCDPPFSACNAIAARNDLNPANGTYPFRALGHRSHGATDVKITSAFLQRTFSFLAVSSPTHNISRGIPPFVWSEFDLGKYILHVGHPNVWMFAPLLHEWEWG